jgi:hypothetical protein
MAPTGPARQQQKLREVDQPGRNDAPTHRGSAFDRRSTIQVKHGAILMSGGKGVVVDPRSSA